MLMSRSSSGFAGMEGQLLTSKRRAELQDIVAADSQTKNQCTESLQAEFSLLFRGILPEDTTCNSSIFLFISEFK